MSDLKFHCPNCDQHLESGEETRGKSIECPTCGVGFTVPCTPTSPALASSGKVPASATAEEARSGSGFASGSDQLMARQAGSYAVKAIRSKSWTLGPALLASSALLVVGFVVISVLFARAGKPLPLGAAEHADAAENSTALADQHSPIKVRSSAILPEEQGNPTEEMLAGVPPEVRKTIQANLGRGEITRIARLSDEGMTVFDVEVSEENLARSFSVALDGQLLSFEVFESELPAEVKAVIERELGKVVFTQIERGSEDGQTVYSVEVLSAGHTNSLTVSEGGDSWNRTVELAQVPAQVQETVRRNWGGYNVTSSSKMAQGEDVAYAFEAEKDGQQHSLTVAPDGRTLDQQDEIRLNQAPPPVQKTVTSQIGAGELTWIARADYQGTVSYDVAAVRDGEGLEFSVNPAGKLLVPDK